MGALGVLALAGAVLAFAASCLSTEGYYRYRDAGEPAGTAGTMGSAGSVGSAGHGGASGAAGTGGASPTGIAGTSGTAGRGGSGAAGTTGVAGTTGGAGTTGVAGTTGAAGTTGTGGSSGTVLLSDDFESGANNWLLLNVGTAMITTDGSKVLDVSDAATKVVIAANGNVAWTDVSIQARVKIVSFSGSSSSYYAGPCVRVLDADNYYCASLRSDGKVSIRGNVAGSGGALTGMTPSSSSSSSYSISPAITTGTWYTVKMTVVGPTITLYVNGALVFTVTDTGIAAGGVGLAINDGEAVFDDVVVTKP